MNVRSHFTSLFLALALAACGGGQETESPRVNLLFILSDQHRGDSLASDGHCLVRTPNLDRLAAQGVRFASAHVQAPLCVPSRASLFTGSYPQLHRASHNACRLPAAQLTWAEVLRERGYRTLSIGRVHGIYDGCEHIRVPDKQATFTYSEIDGLSGGLKVCPVSAEEHWDARIADAAIEELRELGGQAQPFALYVGFFCPHPPFAPPEPYDALYSPGEVAVAPFDRERLENRPSWQPTAGSAGPTRPDVRASMTARYFGLITFLDVQIGRVLDELDALGLAENTVVVYTSDHGSPLGDHGISIKNVSFFESEVRVPALVRYPPGLPAGRVVREPVETIDLVPTFLTLMGEPLPPEFLGSDLGPLIRGEGGRERAYVYSSIDLEHSGASEERGLMIRTERWKLVWFTNDEGELYDLLEDPGELHNLVASEDCREVWDEHWDLLLGHLAWMWTCAPERAVRLKDAGLDHCRLLPQGRGAAFRRDGWELRVHLDGGRELVKVGRSIDRYSDPQFAQRRREMERGCARMLAVGLGPAYRWDKDPALCRD